MGDPAWAAPGNRRAWRAVPFDHAVGCSRGPDWEDGAIGHISKRCDTSAALLPLAIDCMAVGAGQLRAVPHAKLAEQRADHAARRIDSTTARFAVRVGALPPGAGVALVLKGKRSHARRVQRRRCSARRLRTAAERSRDHSARAYYSSLAYLTTGGVLADELLRSGQGWLELIVRARVLPGLAFGETTFRVTVELRHARND